MAEAEAFVAQIGDEIVGLVLDLIGFTDARKCISEGGVGACISTALNAVPWGKMFEAAKVAIKAIGVGKRLVEGDDDCVHGSVGVLVDPQSEPDREHVVELLESAWGHRAPKRALRALDERRAGDGPRATT